MSLFLCLALFLMALGGVWLWHDQQQWRRSLMGYSLRVPDGLRPEELATWLGTLVSDTSTGLFAGSSTVVFEVTATKAGISHLLWVPRFRVAHIQASLQTALPGASLDELESIERPSSSGAVAALSLRQFGRNQQLAVDRAETVSRGLLAALQPLHGSESITWQWIIRSRPPLSSSDKTNVSALKVKQRHPLVAVSGRVLVSSGSTARSRSLLTRCFAPVTQLSVPEASLSRGWWPSLGIAYAVRERIAPLIWWPLTLNTPELAALVAIPTGTGDPLPGVPTPIARQLAPHTGVVARKGMTVLAESNYSGSRGTPLGLSRQARTHHVWLTAPTGAGKSHLQVAMALQDIRHGDGLAFFDPKGDAIPELLARIPAHRRDDVILIDPADISQPVGINLLSHGSLVEQELAVDQIIHVFRQQWKKSWGPRTEMILRLVLLALSHARALDGSPFTLCETPAMLTNRQFRHFVMQQPGMSEPVVTGLRWFDGLGDAQQAQVIGPVMNKLTAFTIQTPTRLLFGQSHGLNLRKAMQQNKIVLVALRRGHIGSETASLVGSVFLAGLWQAGMARSSEPVRTRRPYWLYLDEAHTVVRLPVTDTADMLAEARGLGIGIVGGNQYMSQLPDSVRQAVLSTVRSHIVFQLDVQDAQVFSRLLAPHITAADVRHLGKYEVVMRLAEGGTTGRPVTGRTQELPTPVVNPDTVSEVARLRHGTPRVDVESGLKTRLEVRKQPPQHNFGARRIDGGDQS